MYIIPAFGRLTLEDHKFKTCLSYRERPCLKEERERQTDRKERERERERDYLSGLK
jgi:hypothetical protein